MITAHPHIKTAILLFAQTKATESNHKYFAKSKKKNINLWHTLNCKALTSVKKTALPYFISNETNQIGATFGEKLKNAISATFEKGFDKVVVIGNDCPQLTSKKILSAAHDLQYNDFVFGPDFNGGLYLTGVSKNNFCEAEFLAIPWQTKKVFETLTANYPTKSILVLEKLNDVNSVEDLLHTFAKLKYNFTIKRLLDYLFQINRKFRSTQKLHFSPFIISNNFNKGSPIVVSF